MAETKKSNFENINDLLKAVLWPLVVVIILVSYNADITDMFRNSSKVSLGDFSMEIQREAKSRGASELSGVITELSISGIKHLLAMGNSEWYNIVGESQESGAATTSFYLPADLDGWIELEQAGLLKGENFKIADAINEFKRLGAEEKKVYFNDEGYTTSVASSEYPHSGIQYQLSASHLDSKTRQDIRRFSMKLTEQGKKALDIIIETTARQIKVKT